LILPGKPASIPLNPWNCKSCNNSTGEEKVMHWKFISPRLMGCSLLWLFLVSCASPLPADTPTPPPPIPTPIPPTRTPLPPPLSPEFPIGTFYHKHNFQFPSYCVWQFYEDGTYKYYYEVSSLDVSGIENYTTGTYHIDGNLYTDTATNWSECPWLATYTWTYDGRNLTFQVVGEDKCSNRQRSYESDLFFTRKE
jgi:hypothetical protein